VQVGLKLSYQDSRRRRSCSFGRQNSHFVAAMLKRVYPRGYKWCFARKTHSFSGRLSSSHILTEYVLSGRTHNP